MKIQKILVVRVGNLGDVLMATPVIRKLKKVFPESRIDFVTSNHAQVCVQANRYASDIIVYRKYKRIVRPIKKFFFERSLARNRYDLCCVLEQHPQYHRFARHVMGRHGLTLGITSVPETNFLDHTLPYDYFKKHTIECALFLLKDFLGVPIDEDDYVMDFAIPDDVEQSLKNLLPVWKGESGKYFVIHPGCNGYLYLRTWIMSNYRTVLRFLRQKGYRIFLTGTKLDRHFTDEIMKNHGPDEGVQAFIDRHLYDVAFLIRHASGVLSPDTGIMHIARAMRTPMVVLFGPTNPLYTGCIGPGKYVQIRNDFKCGPCNDDPVYRLKNRQKCINEGITPACMRSITVDQVMGGLEKILT